MNQGAALASGQYLCFLHADTQLPEGASDSINKILRQPQNIAGAFSLRFDREGLLYRFYSRCSRINHTLFTYGDQTLFLRTEDFHQLGGFAPLPFLEDIELQARLRKRGRFEKSRLTVTTSARRFEKAGPLRQQMRNIAIVAAYKAGFSPETLYMFYR